MNNLPKISDSEWEVMKIIWDAGTCTANYIVDKLSNTSDWKPKTIRTLINRLITKEAIGYTIDEYDKKTYHYYPLLQKGDCIKDESKSFLQRVFSNAPNAMLKNFINECELKDEDIDELIDILSKKKN